MDFMAEMNEVTLAPQIRALQDALDGVVKDFEVEIPINFVEGKPHFATFGSEKVRVKFKFPVQGNAVK